MERPISALFQFSIASTLLLNLFLTLAPRQCDQIGQFIGLWATSKAFGNN